ncbi:hypothetical protein V2J09_022943 [Rumex salicifolius]
MADGNGEEYSAIADKGEVGFIDFADDLSVTSYNPTEEGPVIVSVPFPCVNGKPQSVPVNEVAAASFTIENTTSEDMVIWGVSIHASEPEDSFILSLMKPPSGQPDDIPEEDFVGSYSMEDRTLKPHGILTIWLSCEPKEIGIFTSIVHIDIGDDRIERVVFLLVEDKVSKDLASEKPYQRGRRKNAFVMDSYITGIRPAKTGRLPFRKKLPLYNIPPEIREVIENKEIPEVVLQGLTRKNYASYFRTLLIMEELRIEEDMKAYYMECVTLRQKGRYLLALDVPGLAERRPSLVHGDAVFVRLVNDPSGKGYEGCIHRVEADEVFLQFADVFHKKHRDQDFYDVRFAYNRVNFRRLYQAIESAEALHRRFLFPHEYDGKRRIIARNLKPISCLLNEEQANAVRSILGCKGGAPYVIHGPPGTGKTKTLVEVILQLYKTRRNSQILVCASSNCAADHVLEKILCEGMELSEEEIFRLNATSRPLEDMSDDYLRFCFHENDIFQCPSRDVLCKYRIIITTYMSASSLYASGVRRGHFSHIILDEAGQASEPETMVPISNLCETDTVIVLAGDPMQLGPVIHSKEAESYGLGKSYLERLFESALYRSEDHNYVTMLVKNYRSHPEILSLPSRLFYRGALIPSREESEESSLPWADLLPNSKFPVMFFGIQGMDEREGSNPSWFNRIEASKVVDLIKKLLERKVSEHDIGIIAPYRQQVLKIRKALETLKLLDVKIGSVEQFQGQEREVIIVSTVRSTVKHNEFDKTFCLGFLSNPKRFNVAMTRARSLLIIVGNPHIIKKDWHWNQMLCHCTDNSSYQGCAPPVKKQDLCDGSVLDDSAHPTDYWEPQAGDWGSGGEWSGVNDDSNKPVKDEDEWSDGWKRAQLSPLDSFKFVSKIPRASALKTIKTWLPFMIATGMSSIGPLSWASSNKHAYSHPFH